MSKQVASWEVGWDQHLAGTNSIPSVMLGTTRETRITAALDLSFQEMCMALLFLHLQFLSPSRSEEPCCSTEHCVERQTSFPELQPRGSGDPCTAQLRARPCRQQQKAVLVRGWEAREQRAVSEMEIKSCKCGRGRSKNRFNYPSLCINLSLIAWRFCRIVVNCNLSSGTEMCSGPQCLVFRTV